VVTTPWSLAMVYNREVKSIQNDLQRAWQGVQAATRQMHPSSQIRPADATVIFMPDGSSDDPRFNIGPVVFHVPERANGRGSNLYVALSGWLSFGGPVAADPRRTTLRFGTQVGYFRAKGEKLVHIYGVHYDMDEELPGHPVFHAQMSSQVELGADVSRLFNLQLDIGDDLPGGLLRNVRTPTAQMDVFSVIIQIGADHLISEASGPEVHAAFARLRESCDFFMGAAGRLAYLNSVRASHCYRSTHWYGRSQAEVA
jgi:hypothetical protein